MLRFFIVILSCFIFHQIQGQKAFEGRIVYDSGPGENMKVVYYFSQKKVRIDFTAPSFPGEKAILYSIQIFDADSDIVYFILPEKKLIQKIILDTLIQDELHKTILLSGEKEILGYKCYGIQREIREEVKMKDTVFSTNYKEISWYAKDLIFPFRPSLLSEFEEFLDNNHICLQTEMIFSINNDPPENQTKIKAVEIEQTYPEKTVFELPTGFEIKEIKASEFSQESKIELVEIVIEEEKAEPPPPPPPPPTPKKKVIKKGSKDN